MNTQENKNWWEKNAANIVTIFGLALCFILVWFVALHRDYVVAIFALATGIIISDWVDGPIARHYESISKWGAGIDRFRDKVFQFTMYVFILLEIEYAILRWETVLLAVIEIGLLATLLVGSAEKKEVKAGPWGKAKMATVCVGIIAFLLVALGRHHGIDMSAFYAIVCLAFTLAICFGVMSLVGHIDQYFQS
jgi:CDP-diacylglycerol--glycerol-3-phosphate 3-phosphatidyltransferase